MHQLVTRGQSDLPVYCNSEYLMALDGHSPNRIGFGGIRDRSVGCICTPRIDRKLPRLLSLGAHTGILWVQAAGMYPRLDLSVLVSSL